MDFALLLRFAVDNDASDIHLQSGLPPCLRIGGILRSTSTPPLAVSCSDVWATTRTFLLITITSAPASRSSWSPLIS